MNKLTTPGEAVKKVRDGDTILVGGFLMAGSPETLIKALLESSAAKDLAIVSNDTGTAESNMIKVMKQGRVSKVIASYIGANPMTGQMLIDDPDSVTLYPQGTLRKNPMRRSRHRSFHTPVGVGTVIENGKENAHLTGRDTCWRRQSAERCICEGNDSG